MSYDVVTARLRCLRCGHVTPEGESVIQVRFQVRPSGQLLRPGDRLELRDPAAGSYLTLREPGPDEPLRILDTWTCPACGAGFEWALITIRDLEWLDAVESVPLTRATLARAHYVTDDLRLLYALYTGQEIAPDGTLRPDWLEVLRAALPA